jgi:predicted secreted protein
VQDPDANAFELGDVQHLVVIHVVDLAVSNEIEITAAYSAGR